MANLFDYLAWRGDLAFSVSPFNEVDNLIYSMLSIMNYSEIVSAPLIALRGLTLYPKMILHFDAGRSRSVKAVEYAMKRKAPIFLVTQKDIRVEDNHTILVCFIGAFDADDSCVCMCQLRPGSIFFVILCYI